MNGEEDARAIERARRDAEIERIKMEMQRAPQSSSMSKQRESSNASESSSDSSSEESDNSSSSSSSSSSSDDEDEDDVRIVLPIRNPLLIPGQHFKAVTRIALDKNGTRMVSGSVDGVVNVWDTARIGPDMRPFRTLSSSSTLTGEAIDQAATGLAFNCTSALFAVARSDPQVRIFTRDVSEGKSKADAKFTTTRGDPYIRDMSKTKGHVGEVAGVIWHSHKPEVFFTGGMQDGTIRVWDVEHGSKALMGLEIACSFVLKTAVKPGARTSVQAFCCSSDSKRVMAACSGSTIQSWDVRMGGAFGVHPDKQVDASASLAGQDWIQIAIDPSNRFVGMATRKGVQLRDVRKLDSVVWEKFIPEPKGMIKALSFFNDQVAIGSVHALMFLKQSDGSITSETHGEGFSSNLCFSDGQLVMGRSDGAVLFTFASTDRDWTKSESKTMSLRQVADSSSSYARVDQSALQGESVIMSGMDARHIGQTKKKMRGIDADD